jgi:hypothetical protein
MLVVEEDEEEERKDRLKRDVMKYLNFPENRAMGTT